MFHHSKYCISRLLFVNCIKNHRFICSFKKYIPRRAMIYVPGSEENKLQKIPKLGADCVVMDCEDGVALNKKEDARKLICKMLDNFDFGEIDKAVRVNDVSSGLLEGDLNAIFSAKNLPETILLPKVNTINQIEEFSDCFSNALKNRQVKNKINLITYVESALGLLDMRMICQKAIELSMKHSFILEGVVFGSDDFCANIEATRSSEAHELLYARQHVIVVAKAFGLQAIDIVYINYKDLDGLRKQAVEGAKMGFTGKQVIHPSQVSVVQEAFSPSTEKITWALDLISAFEKHQQSGKGAFTFQGHMIDMPLLLQAKNIIKLAHNVKSNIT